MPSKRKLIGWYTGQEGHISYCLSNQAQPDCYDCLGALTMALVYSGYLPQGMDKASYDDLISLKGSLLIPITSLEVEAGDIFIRRSWSPHKEAACGLALSRGRIIYHSSRRQGIHRARRWPHSDSRRDWYRLSEPSQDYRQIKWNRPLTGPGSVYTLNLDK